MLQSAKLMIMWPRAAPRPSLTALFQKSSTAQKPKNLYSKTKLKTQIQGKVQDNLVQFSLSQHEIQ